RRSHKVCAGSMPYRLRVHRVFDGSDAAVRQYADARTRSDPGGIPTRSVGNDRNLTFSLQPSAPFRLFALLASNPPITPVMQPATSPPTWAALAIARLPKLSTSMTPVKQITNHTSINT